MTNLKAMQTHLNQRSAQVDWELWEELHNAYNLASSASALKAYLEMSVNFRGKETVVQALKDYGFEDLLAYLN